VVMVGGWAVRWWSEVCVIERTVGEEGAQVRK
jgi:hypothetical protein